MTLNIKQWLRRWGMKPCLRSVFFFFNARCMQLSFFSKIRVRLCRSGFVYLLTVSLCFRRTPHPFIRCFNVHLIYRLRTCLSVLKKVAETGGSKRRIKTALNRERRLRHLCSIFQQRDCWEKLPDLRQNHRNGKC